MPLKIARHNTSRTNATYLDQSFSPVAITYPVNPRDKASTYLGGVGGSENNSINSATNQTINCAFVDANGNSWTDGYITSQRGEYQFEVQSMSDLNSTTTTRCRLVSTSTANLTAKQMNIQAVDGRGNLFFARKIDSKFVWYNHKHPYILGTAQALAFVAAAGGITFTDSKGLTVGPYALVNSGGTIDANASYPVPGSGTYLSAATAFTGMTYALQGTTATVSGGIATVPNQGNGLWRTKYQGDWVGPSPSSSTSTWDMNFFTTATYVSSISDTYVSWGAQTDSALQQYFSQTFYGYFQVPTTQNYNVYVQVDDDVAIWIGSPALNPTNANWTCHGSNQSMPGSSITNANTLALTAGVWYPITIYMAEFSGSTKFQIFFQGANGTNYNGHDLTWAYNKATFGF